LPKPAGRRPVVLVSRDEAYSVHALAAYAGVLAPEKVALLNAAIRFALGTD